MILRVADRLHCSAPEAAALPRYWREAALAAISAENGAARERQLAADRRAKLQQLLSKKG